MTIIGRIALLTVVFGVSVVAAWTIVGGPTVWRGNIGPVLAERGWLLFGAISLASAALLFVLVRTRWRHVALVHLGAMVALAWFGEGLVLVVFGPAIADEIAGSLAWLFWLVATGYGLQPVAALVGAVAARRWSARRSVTAGA